MNNPNPLLPQGAIPPKPKSTLYIKILMIVAVHVVLLGGLLIVGCKDTAKTSSAPKSDVADTASKDPMSPTKDDFGSPATPANSTAATTAPLPGSTTTALPATASPALPAATTPAPTTVSAIPNTMSPMSLPASTAAVTTPSATGGSVYVIAKGEILASIAKKNGVSLKALEEANPGVDPKKLQIGQKLQIPAGNTTASTTAAGSSSTTSDATSAATGDSSTYIVKSGDVLLKIAKAHGTTVKALEALNDMKTASIKAGQKLKVPVMKMASVDTTPAAPAATTVAPTGATGMTTAPTVRAN
jgi:LysM repeat protein